MAEDVKWYGEEFEKELDKIIKGKLLLMVYRLERIIQEMFRAAKSGRIYTRGSVQHKASAPGQAPAIDTAALSKGVTHSDPEKIGGVWSVDSGMSNEGGRAEIAEMLELGTSNIEPRPVWRPALERLKQEADAVMQEGN